MSPRTPAFLRSLILGLAVLLSACQDSSDPAPAGKSGAPATSAPDYWPTAGWQTATPESQGFSTGAFDSLASDAATALPYHTSLLVIRNGWLVHESYHDPDPSDLTEFNSNTLHNVWSVTKSVTSLTLGRAWTAGLLDSADLDATIATTMPAGVVATLPADDPRRGISLRHALQMRSGLEWNEPAWLLDTNYDPIYQAMNRAPPCAFDVYMLLCSILQQASAFAPGTVWNYNTYDTYLVSAFFTQLTGQQLNDYARLNLFGPLGIAFNNSQWSTMGTAYTFGGGLLNITARDLAKLGLLVQYEGRWEDYQVISKDWLDFTTAPQGAGLMPAFGGDERPSGSSGLDIPYGMQWWRPTDFGGTPPITAIGMGGQTMHVFRDKGLLVVITCTDVTVGAPSRQSEITAFVKDNIVAKLTD